jgi:CspA family cold shock protein
MNSEDLEIFERVFGAENVVVFDEVNHMVGTVSRLIADKGFGFITGEDGVDYFFHRSDLGGFFDDLAADVAKGRKIKVNFDIVPSPKGPRAGNVTRIDGGV